MMSVPRVKNLPFTEKLNLFVTFTPPVRTVCTYVFDVDAVAHRSNKSVLSTVLYLPLAPTYSTPELHYATLLHIIL
jgi:hypothetical protein